MITTRTSAEEKAEAGATLATITSLTVSLFPYVGEGYDVLTLLVGQDPLTKEELTKFTKVLTVAGLMSGVGSGSAARKIGTEALERLAKELGVTLDELLPIAEKVAANYKITSLDDLKGLKSKLSIDSFVSEVRGVAKGIFREVNSLAKEVQITLAGRGSTGRMIAKSLSEENAMRTVLQNPSIGTDLSTKGLILSDPRWLASEGWVKMVRNIDGIEIHWLRNVKDTLFDDFKFID